MPTLWSLIFTRERPNHPSGYERILRKLETLENHLTEQRRQLMEIKAALKRAEENYMAENPVIQRIVDEVEQTRGAVASAVVFIKAVPDMIRQAVTEALATNPGADLSRLEGLAESLDAAQSELTAAMQANPSIVDEGDAQSEGGVPQPVEPLDETEGFENPAR